MMAWTLFAVCDLCGEQKVILGSVIHSFGGKNRKLTHHKCLACHKHYYFWKDQVYISTNGLTYIRSGKKPYHREWRIA